MTPRDFSGPFEARAIRDAIQGLLVAEALAPSDPLWLLSGWVSDIAVIDNGARQFAAIEPDWPASPVPLSTVLGTILARGGRLNVVLRSEDHNQTFIDRLRGLQRRHPGRVQLLQTPDAHEKALVGRGFTLEGSMNLTHSGIARNREHVVLRTDPADVAARRLDLDAVWGGRLNAAD